MFNRPLHKPQTKEPDMVTVHRFMDANGKDYWAKEIRSTEHVAYPLQSRQVIKGSKEDQ